MTTDTDLGGREARVPVAAPQSIGKTMREYYDGMHGPGAWDLMHDQIERGEFFSFVQPMVRVRGNGIVYFPGDDREVTLEAVIASLDKEIYAKARGE